MKLKVQEYKYERDVMFLMLQRNTKRFKKCSYEDIGWEEKKRAVLFVVTFRKS